MRLVELHLNRVYIPRRAVYLDAIAESPELRLGILYFLWRKSAILGKNRALKKVQKWSIFIDAIRDISDFTRNWTATRPILKALTGRKTEGLPDSNCKLSVSGYSVSAQSAE